MNVYINYNTEGPYQFERFENLDGDDNSREVQPVYSSANHLTLSVNQSLDAN